MLPGDLDAGDPLPALQPYRHADARLSRDGKIRNPVGEHHPQTVGAHPAESHPATEVVTELTPEYGSVRALEPENQVQADEPAQPGESCEVSSHLFDAVPLLLGALVLGPRRHQLGCLVDDDEHGPQRPGG